MAGAPRFALYYAPALDDPLWRRAATWLGRDPDSDAAVAQPGLADIAAITADPRRYGFHATLKPPFRLADGYGWTDVMAAAEAIARGIAAFDLPPLGVQAVHGFLALRESLESPALQALSDACVAGADHLRAPPDAAELRRRGAGSLAPAQEEMLRRWGYPYVFSTWFFHMTLTRRLDSGEDAIYRPAATAFFADCLDLPRRVRDICVFSESAPGAPFRLAARVPLRG